MWQPCRTGSSNDIILQYHILLQIQIQIVTLQPTLGINSKLGQGPGRAWREVWVEWAVYSDWYQQKNRSSPSDSQQVVRSLPVSSLARLYLLLSYPQPKRPNFRNGILYTGRTYAGSGASWRMGRTLTLDAVPCVSVPCDA